MNTVILTVGLPGSGKTTWSLEQMKKYPGKYKRINKDDLRAMVDGGEWSKKNEGIILEMRDKLILAALSANKNVIVDDTNLNPTHKKHIENLVVGKALVIEKVFDTPVEECVKRDAARPNPVGEKVIRDMAEKYIVSCTSEQCLYVPPKDKPDAIIVDIDGTLAHMNGRGPHEYHRVEEDSLDETIHAILLDFKVSNPDASIILLSGRQDMCDIETQRWLTKHMVPYSLLYMRKEGDHRKDYIIKKEIFDEHIRNNFNVKYVLDDRDQVVEMWRSLGLKCLQVAPGAF